MALQLNLGHSPNHNSSIIFKATFIINGCASLVRGGAVSRSAAHDAGATSTFESGGQSWQRRCNLPQGVGGHNDDPALGI